MCESSIGWPLVYYVCAGCGIVFFILWFIFFDDTPEKSRYASNQETALIQMNRGEEEVNKIHKTPYVSILTNPMCLTIWYNSFAEIATSFFLYGFVAKFHNGVLGFDVPTAGLLSGLPSAVYIPLRILMGHVNDKIS